MIKGDDILQPGVPESFKVLVKELQSLGLAMEVINEEETKIAPPEETVEDALEETLENTIEEAFNSETELPPIEQPEWKEEGDDVRG